MTLTPQTLSQLQTDTRILVGDPASLANSFSDSMVTDAINFAIQHYCRLTGVSYIEATAAVNASGQATVPNQYIEIRRVGYGTPTVWLLNTTYQDEVIKYPSFQASSGTPKRWFLYSGSTIQVTPNPASGNVTIGFVEEPTPLANLTDSVDARIPVTHQRALKYAAASWLLRIDGDNQDFAAADAHMNTFVDLIKQV